MAFRVWRYIKKYPYVKKLPPWFSSLQQSCQCLMNKHFTWKRRKSDVMKKKTISSIKYLCHNKQLKSVHKFMPMNISQQIITFNIKKNFFFNIKKNIFFFFSFWTQNYSLSWYLCLLNPSVCCSITSIGLDLKKF